MASSAKEFAKEVWNFYASATQIGTEEDWIAAVCELATARDAEIADLKRPVAGVGSAKEFAEKLAAVEWEDLNAGIKLIEARDADLTRLARAQAVSVLVERRQGKEFPLTPHDTAEACVTMCDIQEICRELLTPSDKDVLAKKTSYEKLKAMMESEEGWIAPDKVAEHEKELDERYKKKLADYCEMVDKEQVVKQAEHDRQVRLKEAEWWHRMAEVYPDPFLAENKRLAELRAGKEPQL